MLKILITALVAAPLVGLSPSLFRVDAASQAQPRRGQNQPAEPRRDPAPPQGRAQPREPAPPAPPQGGRGGDQGGRDGDQNRGGSQGRRVGPPPPPRVVPPSYYRTPRVYYFPPVHVNRGFYYHPYFGFYFGPYYGPYYPYPGPAYGPARYTSSALRTRVRPVETQVYVNGYFAGIADDFDGLFQRLYLPSGGHEIEFRLDGYERHVERIYLQASDTYEITHQMVLARPGVTSAVPLPHGALPPEWRETSPPMTGDRPASPYGILAVRVSPSDAEVAIDGEAWVDTGDLSELVVHVPAGEHVVEVRKPGYQTFRVEVELSEGATTRLNVRLTR